MRRTARTDTNPAEAVVALRAVGYTVQHLHTLRKGTPNLLMRYVNSPRAVQANVGRKKTQIQAEPGKESLERML